MINYKISSDELVSIVIKLTGPVEPVGETYEDTKRIKALNKLPSAQSERKTGKWVELSHGILFHIYKCNLCGNTIDINGINEGRGNANYCPSCGARMDGEEDG